MSKVRLVLTLVSAGLVALALSATSATAATAPALKVCKKVPTGEKGLWNSSKCNSEESATGSFAWAWAGSKTTTVYCVLGGSSFSDELCEHASGSGPFKEVTATEATPKVEASILLSTLKSKVAGAENVIDCTGGSSKGTGESATLLGSNPITYTGCTSVKPTKCVVANKGGTEGTIETKALMAKLLSLTETEFSPEAVGGAFVEIEYKNKGTETCSLKGEVLAVTGTQKCVWEGAVQTPTTDKLLGCKTSGSNLKLGTQTATYEGINHVHLEGTPFWKIQ
jgi:hypothetical protein